MRGVQKVCLSSSVKPGMIEASIDPWALAETSQINGCWIVRGFSPSVEDGAYRTMNWSAALGSLDRAQLLLGLQYYYPEIGAICFHGLKYDEAEGAKEVIGLPIDWSQISDESVLGSLRDGFRQGLQAEDVILELVMPSAD